MWNRRWFRFSLRTLVVLITICAIVLAIFAAYLAPYYREQRLIADLQEEREIHIKREAYGPWWLKRFAQGEYAQRVRIVGARQCELSVEELASFRTFRRLDDVRLYRVRGISNAHTEQLGRLSGLQRLWFLETGISNEALAHLRGLKNLTDLEIDTPMVTDDGLRHVGELTSLRRLVLRCNATDEGLKHIGSLTNLRELVIKCRVTDAGMAHLGRLKNLETLNCHGYPERWNSWWQLEDERRFEFTEVSLGELCSYLSALLDLSIRLDPEALQTEGIKPDVTVTANYNSIETHTMLDEVLDPLGLVWLCDDQGITVTTKELEASRRPHLAALKRDLKNLKEVSTDW